MKKKKNMIVMICIVFILLAVPAGYKLRIRGSVHVDSHSDYTANEIAFFLQKDPRWSSEKLGSSSYTMARSGCLTTCIAAELKMQNMAVPAIQKEENGDEKKIITPGDLNGYFSEQGVYDAEGNIQWNVLEQVLGVEVVRKQASQLHNGELDTLLSEGVFPIVYVRVNGRGNFHFVLITGSMDGEFLCMDPLSEKQVTVPLSRFGGGKVYAVRYISKRTD